MTSIINLDQVDRDQVALFGGKSANLGELIQQGFPVPPGFIVTAAAYYQFVSNWDLTSQTPQQIQLKIMAQPIDPGLDAELQAHHRELAKNIWCTY